MPIQQTCTIAYRDTLNAHAVRMELNCGRMVRDTFRAPGQFLHIQCGAERLLRRPISVCTCLSEPVDEDLVTIVFEVRGEGTAWLAQRREGDTLDVLGMLGGGFSIDPAGRYLLVGGGIGVPPLFGCAQYADGRCDAVLGFRDSERLLLLPEFERHCSQVVTVTEDGSTGERGYVTAPMERLLRKNRYDAVLACGPRPMLKSVSKVAVEFGVPCQVSMEERMACGVGACLGCAIRMKDGTMKHVCKDGPVFLAEEVDWDA